MADSRSTCMLEAGELIAARAHPEDVRVVGELVGKDSETPFHDLSGDGVTRSGRVRRIVVGGCLINPGKNVVVIRVDGMDKGKTKKETYNLHTTHAHPFCSVQIQHWSERHVIH